MTSRKLVKSVGFNGKEFPRILKSLGVFLLGTIYLGGRRIIENNVNNLHNICAISRLQSG